MWKEIGLEMIADATHQFVGAGQRVFQAFRFAETDEAHLDRLERWAELPHAARVIDLGSGIGEVARRFQTRRPDLRFFLVNISQAQLAYAPEFPHYCGDFCQVPEPDGSFDAALFCFSIGHAHREHALRSAFRFLRPGGILFIYDMVRVAGDNRGMQSVSYLVEPRGAMEWTAHQVGFVQDLYLEPVDRWRHGEKILGPMFHTIFQGTVPAVWRYVKH